MSGYQILGIRSFFDEKTRKQKKYDAFFEMRWRFDDFAAMLKNPTKVLDENKVPESERWNLFYTVSVAGDTKRSWAKTEILPFDLDGINLARRAEYIEPVLKVLGVDPNKTAVIFSGNGLHFLVKLYPSIEDKKFYDERRSQYKAICAKINRELERLRLPGKADTAVFDAARILRFPCTLNRKPDKQRPDILIERMAEIIQGDLEPQPFDFDAISEQPKLSAEEAISEEELRKFVTRPDGKEAIEQCLFLAHARDNAGTIDEPQWYAAASIVGRFKDGKELFHEMSKGHPGYSASATDDKLAQALEASGPRTCKNINTIWGKCNTCPLFEKIKSPVMIFGKDIIETEVTGFHKVTVKNGELKTIPCQGDLLKAFKRDYPYFYDPKGKRTYAFNGKFWEVYYEQELKAYAEQRFNPEPKENVRVEFFKKVIANHVWRPTKVQEFLYASQSWKINLNNCVVDPLTNEVTPHSSDYGFTYVLPYTYQPDAKAPKFLRFLDEVTLGRKDLQETLLDFLAYILVPRYDDHCFLWLPGEGRNGKSSYMNVLKGIAGAANTSFVLMDQFEDQFSLAQLNHKLLNYAEESEGRKIPPKTMTRLKILSAGGTLSTSEKNEKNFDMPNTAKLVFSSNKIPVVDNIGQAVFSRMIVVPFELQLENFRDEASTSKINAALDDELAEELPGIFNLAASRIRERAGARFKVARNKAGTQYVKEIFLNSDSVERWVVECAEINKDAKSWGNTLYLDYTTFIGSEKYSSGMQTFINKLRKLPGVSISERSRNGSERGYWVNGLTLKNYISNDGGGVDY